MPTKKYQDTIDWLFAQFPSYQLMGSSAYKPGLENVNKLCEALGHPESKLKFVHVAGSNGKGSTASMMASFLTENNEKVGLFTSPHLVDFRERIRVNGEMIDEASVIQFCEKIQKLELDFEPSFFEISFCMSLEYFVSMKCGICVIETGLGGRLDATNVIAPALSIITVISLEHTNFLGDTLEKIAGEKAGIIKQNIPVVIGARQKETSAVFETKAQEMQASIFFSDSYAIDFDRDFPLLGDYQKENFKTACLASLVLNQEKETFDFSKWLPALVNIVKNTGYQGRLQVMSESPRVIFDVSHNTEGIQKTLKFLNSESTKSKLHIVYGSSADKNFDAIFTLFPKDAIYYLTEFENERSATEEKLKNAASKEELNCKTYSSANQALEESKKAANDDDTILVFGSFFLLHDFLK